jgi:hypothetical protein
MVITDDIRLQATQVKSIIVFYTILLLINTFAHENIDMLYSMIPYIWLFIFICLAPIIVAFLLSTQFARHASVVLLGILSAILIYNIITRFSALPVLFSQNSSFFWKVIYEGSFGLMLVSEVIAIWLTFKLLREIHKQIDSPSGKIHES